MTTLSDLLKDLTYGELKQLSVGNFLPDELDSNPDPKSWELLLSYINLGLKEIYKRFCLSAKEIYIEQDISIETYLLSSTYAQSNTASLIPLVDRFIADSVSNPFQDDILKIEQCYDEAGNLLFLNDPTEDLSIFTPSYRSIQIPYPNEFDTLAVQYRASHPKVVYSSGMDPLLIELELPESLHEALLYYIGNRAFASLNTDQGVEGNDYWQKFNDSCDRVNLLGLYVQPEVGNFRFDNAGWV